MNISYTTITALSKIYIKAHNKMLQEVPHLRLPLSYNMKGMIIIHKHCIIKKIPVKAEII